MFLKESFSGTFYLSESYAFSLLYLLTWSVIGKQSEMPKKHPMILLIAHTYSLSPTNTSLAACRSTPQSLSCIQTCCWSQELWGGASLMTLVVLLQDSLHHQLSRPSAVSGFCPFLKQFTWPLGSSQLILIFNPCWPRVVELFASLAISSLIFRSFSSVPPSRIIGCEENYWNELYFIPFVVINIFPTT